MTRNKLFLLPILFLLFVSLTAPDFLPAQERAVVGFGGLWTAGSEANYPLYSRIKQKYHDRLTRAISVAIEKVAADLPFEILFETDAERMKKHIDNPYSLAVAITRDDVITEHFATSAAEIHKTIVNVGMVIILYQTVRMHK